MANYIYKNKTNKHIAIGDLKKLPTLKPKNIEDFSVYQTLEEIENSKVLNDLQEKDWIEPYSKGKTKSRHKSHRKNKARKNYKDFSVPYFEKSKKMTRKEISSKSSQFLGYQIKNQNIPELWQKTDGKNVTIAVIDTGVDYNHQDLSKSFSDNADLKHNDDQASHGSHVAGVIAANNNRLGIVGVAPKAKIVPIRVLDENGRGTMQDVIDGVNKAVDMGVDVINMSLGTPYDYSQFHNVIKRAYDAQIPVVCAAGNAGDIGKLSFPANYLETIAVGALDKEDARASFSEGGTRLDVMAPGVKILSTTPNNTYSKFSGTSMSSPFVAGVVALMLSYHNKFFNTDEENNIDKVKRHLTQNAIDLRKVGEDKYTGYGLVDVNQSIENIDKGPNVIVSDMQGNPPGKDAESLKEEFVEIENVSGKTLDLSSWKVTDQSGFWELEIPENTKIKPKETKKIITGVNENNDENNIYWNYRRPIWNNKGDTFYLTDPQGVIQTKYSF